MSRRHAGCKDDFPDCAAKALLVDEAAELLAKMDYIRNKFGRELPAPVREDDDPAP